MNKNTAADDFIKDMEAMAASCPRVESRVTPETKRHAVNIIFEVEELIRGESQAPGELVPVYRPGYVPDPRFEDEPEPEPHKDISQAELARLLDRLDQVADLTDEKQELVRAQELTHILTERYGVSGRKS
ncbi:MAG: hypothetical protein Q8P56_01265 [Candidatus Uhrbacteria bacterium]|nr:hypothetical protein [Candidatus Uhrbacteria bacterium]